VHGEWVWHRSSGEIMQRGGFDHGRKHGTWTRWNTAGEMVDRGDYANDKKVGEWTTFNPDGTVKRTVTHRARR